MCNEDDQIVIKSSHEDQFELTDQHNRSFTELVFVITISISYFHCFNAENETTNEKKLGFISGRLHLILSFLT